jgi:two-component system, sensor histidine kinase LadS
LVTALYFRNQREQENLKKSKMLLIEQSRFNSIGQAIGHVSHQWKSPLTSVGTSLTLLETIYNHDPERLITTFEKQLPLMKKSITLMKKSMDEFSNFYQTKAQKEEFLLIDSIFNIVEILSSKIILKRVEIVYEIEENLKLRSYEHIISNIFLVLINNSLEAFGSGDNNIKISAKQNEKEMVITYEDNAGGIKIKPIESVFDHFVSAKENKKSSGIGLAVVKLLVNERLNGKISVKNSNNGVIFTIII